MKNRVLVQILACGNQHRRDDGAALWAVVLLRARLPAATFGSLAVTRCDQLDVQHLLDVQSGVPVVLLDAAVGIPAGTVVKRSLDDLIDEPHGALPNSSHALPIDQTLGVANALREEPLEGLFLGIGGADFGYGNDLSPAVRVALGKYVEAIADAIVELRARPVPAGRAG